MQKAHIIWRWLLFLALFLYPLQSVGYAATPVKSLSVVNAVAPNATGGQVVVPVYLTSAGDIYAFQFMVDYNREFMTLQEIRKTDQTSAFSLHTNVIEGKVLLGHPATPIPTGKQKVLELVFQVHPTSEADRSTVQILNPVLTDDLIRNRTPQFTLVQGTVTLPQVVLSSNAELKQLELLSESITPGFQPSVTKYQTTVGQPVSSLNLLAEPDDPKSSVTVSLNGSTVNKGNNQYALTLQEGVNTISLEVVAEDQTKKVYTLLVKRMSQAFLQTQITQPSEGSIVIDPNLTIAGKSEKDSVISIFLDGGTQPIAQVSTGLGGKWSWKSTVSLSDGPHQVVVEAADLLGNKQRSPVRSFVVDTSRKLTLTTTPASVIGDGTSLVTLAASLKAADGTPIPGVRIAFEAELGTLSATEAFTNAQGEAVIRLTAPELEGVVPLQEIITATVQNEELDLFMESSIVMSYMPASIEGTVVDQQNKPVNGATVTLEEDFNEDGIIDFTYSLVTGPDGKYKIFVPRGNWIYSPKITIPMVVQNQVIPVTVTQKAEVGEIRRVGDEISSNKNISGLLLMPDKKDGTPKPLQEVLGEGEVLKTTVKDSAGNIIELPPTRSGSFSIDNVPKGDYSITFQIVTKNEQGEDVVLAGKQTQVTVKEDGEVVVQTELIDPYGVVTDKRTGQPIQGVKMSLYWADTPLNRGKGRTPNSLVILPVLDDFAPNQNHDPQWTNAEGEYAWMVFPEGDYYIVAEHPQYQTYDSRVEKRNRPAGPGEDSYIQNGIIHVGAAIVEYSLTMDPKAGSSSSKNSPAKPEVIPPATASKGYISGYPDQTFRPERKVSRAEMAAMLARLIEDSLTNNGKAPLFQDLPEKHWAYSYIGELTQKGIFEGDPHGRFRPDQTITRAEMASIAMRLKGLKGSSKKSPFPDIPGHWAQAAITAVSEAGFMKGYPDGSFRPDGGLSRAEAVTMINRLFNLASKHEATKSTWKDVSVAHWAFYEIERASSSAGKP